MKKVLSIAGSDCSGGAGIQADIKTICAHNMYAMTAMTALTAQNTTGVYDIMEVSPEFLVKQLDCIFQDIYPNAVKIGMVPNSELVCVIAEKLQEYQVKNVVVDTVMVSTSGSRLMQQEACKVMKEQLFPLGTVLTPNLFEAEVLSGIEIKNSKDMVLAATEIGKYTKGAVLVKGGHLTQRADDLLYENGKEIWYHKEKIDNPNTHGTGCTLSSAIACNLAKGYSLQKSVENAKEYLTGAIQAGLDLGKGRGPLNHLYMESR
ncbi:MAG: bifunctional hydroxymethylpyrimidine kinase/phosphomethylpyrimidine kinase [Blautia sp.]|nr:bifunctional hydroxymethylpyrimidine kinase/phosphomethylpyrimidine kinase [Blautia sp.]